MSGAIGRPVSAPRCAGRKRVIRIAGIHKIGTGGAQHFFDLFDCSSNYTGRLPGLNLALQLEQPPIGAIETLRQHGRHVKERDRVYPKDGGRIGDMKLRGFKRAYVGRVRRASFLWKTAISGIRGVGMFGPPSPLRAAIRKPMAVCRLCRKARCDEAGATVRCFISGWPERGPFPENGESTIS
jgi:hypothetical protein